MVNAFIDTTVLVDFIRHRNFAVDWLRLQTELGVSPIVRMELIAGAHNKIEQLKSIQLFSQLEMVYPSQRDIDWAMEQQVKYS